jgi:hypothetical protein
VATDVEEYFQIIMAMISEETKLAPIGTATIEDVAGDYLTNFDRKARLRGGRVYRAIFQKSIRT